MRNDFEILNDKGFLLLTFYLTFKEFLRVKYVELISRYKNYIRG